jgi:hypothetical protein
MPPQTSLDDDGIPVKPSDERTPLLAPVAPIPTNETIEESQAANVGNSHPEDEDAPLPLLQILLLCYNRVIEPIAFFSIFPYINSMIEKTGGIDTEDVGFYSGLIESLFSATQMCVMIFWGKVSVFFDGISIRLTAAGCRSVRAETDPHYFFARCIGRYFSIWNESKVMANDLFPLYSGCLLWNRCVRVKICGIEHKA